ncbi:MAG TPA: DUF2797 domain-containing protein [Bacteroidaceae bacterium]|nr:DUF2797 domain-containing protein [Bacteroidaceae bacterium]
MHSEFQEPVQYALPVGEQMVPLNQFTGAPVLMEYLGIINCIKCGRETKKSFAQGYCYPCFVSVPETEECVLRPELCRAHLGIARDMAYAKTHCLIEHVVYLSITGGLKVGVTRNTQVPTRWIDQGAVKVIELARTPNRHTAGLLETALKKHLDDKTNWRKMLTGDHAGSVNLPDVKHKIFETMPEDFRRYYITENRELSISYPVEQYPEKVRSMDFDKTAVIEGILTGIKGQYLMFDGDRVINIRKYGGYLVKLAV